MRGTVKLSAELGLNYVPNPTRINLFNDPNFMQKKPFLDFAKPILDYFEPLRKNYADRVHEIIKSYRFVKSSINI
jgi:hypothetical protein